MIDKPEGISKLGSNNTDYNFNEPSCEILETFRNKHPEKITLIPFTQERDEFTSLCPVTHQPDQAKIEIIYVPNLNMVESKSLKLYLFSFRNHGEFHEDVTNRIAKDIWKMTEPKYIRVYGNFAPRGGIAIRPMVETWQDDLPIPVIKQISRLVTAWDIKR